MVAEICPDLIETFPHFTSLKVLKISIILEVQRRGKTVFLSQFVDLVMGMPEGSRVEIGRFFFLLYLFAARVTG